MAELPPLRMGVLGAAKISASALYHPVATNPDVELVAIAARDRGRAQQHAAEHSIASVEDTYEDVLARDDIDAIFNPLPISLHHQWTIAALQAGKHVLCEKPFASNAAQAAEMVAVGRNEGRVLVEAFHWRYHPMATRIDELVDAVGGATRIDALFNAPVPADDAVRRSWELSGGALMDLGCYPVQWTRFAARAEPTNIQARMRTHAPTGSELVDSQTELWLEFSGGCVAHVSTSMDDEFAAHLAVEGPNGRFVVHNPLAPHMGNRIDIELNGRSSTETVEGLTTYQHQMAAFVDAVRNGVAVPTGGADSVATMLVIDRAYVAAGLPRRGSALN
ncbi:MAG: Gfo/Idh/MocA family oxidoreductase [Acidimicrobiales bacterium]